MDQTKHNRIESIKYWEEDRLVPYNFNITQDIRDLLIPGHMGSQIRAILKEALENPIPKEFTENHQGLCVWVPQQLKDTIRQKIHKGRRGQFIRWVLKQSLNKHN